MDAEHCCLESGLGSSLDSGLGIVIGEAPQKNGLPYLMVYCEPCCSI
jgi:hypothetical protein